MSDTFDLLELDTDLISDAQAGDLEIEVSIEIMECLERYVAKQAVYVEDVLFNDEPVYIPTEPEIGWSEWFAAHLENKHIFDTVIELQEEMARSSKEFNALRQGAIDDLNQWYRRFNAWLNSPAYGAYRNKSRAWDIYKKGLKEKKATLALYTRNGIFAKQQKESWWAKKAECDACIGGRNWVWPRYFNLIEEDLPKYWSGVDPEEVDDQVVLNQGPNDVADVLGDMHIVEMAAHTANFKESPANLWGFWSFREDSSTRRQQHQDSWYEELSEMYC